MNSSRVPKLALLVFRIILSLCAAKRMCNCRHPKPMTDPVTTPMPVARRQVQPLDRLRTT